MKFAVELGKDRGNLATRALADQVVKFLDVLLVGVITKHPIATSMAGD